VCHMHLDYDRGPACRAVGEAASVIGTRAGVAPDAHVCT
jgi:hypothetical protein